VIFYENKRAAPSGFPEQRGSRANHGFIIPYRRNFVNSKDLQPHK